MIVLSNLFKMKKYRDLRYNCIFTYIKIFPIYDEHKHAQYDDDDEIIIILGMMHDGRCTFGHLITTHRS